MKKIYLHVLLMYFGILALMRRPGLSLPKQTAVNTSREDLKLMKLTWFRHIIIKMETTMR